MSRSLLITVALLSSSALIALAYDPPKVKSPANAKSPAAAKSPAKAKSTSKDPSKNPKDGPSVWMRQKLDRSKDILEGMAAGDFDKIAKNARSLQRFGKIEAFARSRAVGYRDQLRTFQQASQEIVHQAERENIEGVALAFHQLTNSCVNCHKDLRRSR